jgi:predicted small integral membrane protein
MSRSPEARLFRSSWDDGTLDLVAGGVVVAIGVGYLVEFFLLQVVVIPLAFVVWFALRRRIVEPRAGYVELSRSRRDRSRVELVWAACAGLGLLALVGFVAVRAGGTDSLRNDVDALPSVLVGLAALVASALTRALRFAGYGVFLVLAGVGTVLADTGPGLPIAAGGVVVLVAGGVLLARFLTESRRYRESA